MLAGELALTLAAVLSICIDIAELKRLHLDSSRTPLAGYKIQTSLAIVWAGSSWMRPAGYLT
jgi:hypothetical protein